MPTYSQSVAEERKSQDAAIFINTNVLTATYITGCVASLRKGALNADTITGEGA
jgi:hypothetical protein